MRWPELLDSAALALIALGTVTAFLLLTAYLIVNAPDSELAKLFGQALVTVGFAGIVAFYFTVTRSEKQPS